VVWCRASEINTLLGNINWMKARSSDLQQQCDFNELIQSDIQRLLEGQPHAHTHTRTSHKSPHTHGTLDVTCCVVLCDGGGGATAGCDTQGAAKLERLVDTAKSDSANLDSAFELLVQAGKGAWVGGGP
jgi:glutamate synthase domain-containing protein 1